SWRKTRSSKRWRSADGRRLIKLGTESTRKPWRTTALSTLPEFTRMNSEIPNTTETKLTIIRKTIINFTGIRNSPEAGVLMWRYIIRRASDSTKTTRKMKILEIAGYFRLMA